VIAIVPVSFLIAGLYIQKDPVGKIFSLFAGFFYIALPLAMTNILVFPAVNAHYYTHRIFLGLLILIWINDTGAYVSGMLFGKHRLFPRISPKKSWEGFAGGTVFTLISAFFMTRLMGILNQTDWIILAVVVSVFGVYGDLAESLIKRNAKVKDSGTIIPGHGGILDRFDSMLFVVPVSVIYLLIT
jgi:phosphatidate cytidylyltransferase